MMASNTKGGEIMGITENHKTILELANQIDIEIDKLDKKIYKHFKGIRPDVTHNEYGLDIMVFHEGILEVTRKGFSFEEKYITEELATKIKNEYVEAYGEILG